MKPRFHRLPSLPLLAAMFLATATAFPADWETLRDCRYLDNWQLHADHSEPYAGR